MGLARDDLPARPTAAQDPLEIDMESKLSPRDIQTRIRAGESLDEVARAAGVPAEQIEVFASPVIAELEHVTGSAQAAPVRRTGESSSSRGLRIVVNQRLTERGIDPDTVQWRAWRNPDRRWTIQASYDSGSNPHEALFVYDARARFSIANNDEARWLLGEPTPAHGPQPGRKPRDPDAEPTVDLNDELALVRAIQPDEDARDASTPVAAATDTTVAPGAEITDPQDYREADLEEVDGVYDLVVKHSDLDVLYEMLSGFDEDSVNVYAGLTQPVVDDLLSGDTPPTAEQVRQAVAAQDAAEATPDHDLTDGKLPDREPTAAEDDLPAEPDEDDIVAVEDALDASDDPEPEPEMTDAPELASEEAAQTEDAPPTGHAQTEREITEPEQDPLLGDDEVPEQPKPKPKPTRRKGRASVPSWDEIMFGSPNPKH